MFVNLIKLKFYVSGNEGHLDQNVATLQASFNNITEEINNLGQKVKTAKAIHKDIEKISNLEGFLTDDEIVKKEKNISKKRKILQDLEENVSKAKRLKEEIQQKESDPSYLTEEHITLNEKKIKNAKNALKKMHLSKGSFEESFNEVLEVQQEALKELECVICLDVPKEDVFSCTEHHILCLGCKQKGLLKCPICRQDFAIYPPTRNRVAKRMIQKLN